MGFDLDELLDEIEKRVPRARRIKKSDKKSAKKQPKDDSAMMLRRMRNSRSYPRDALAVFAGIVLGQELSRGNINNTDMISILQRCT